MPARFPFLRYPLQPFAKFLEKLPKQVSTNLRRHLAKTLYPVRLVRYWWAGQALAAESRRLGRPLQVVDVGCELGWLKHFTPEGVVDKWIGLDWNVQEEARTVAGYDKVIEANFEQHLPLESGCADAVVSLHVFEHLLRSGSLMSEISRLLRPRGIFLGGSPTMPQWLARLRERYLRRRLEEGKISPGGHITVLSPRRWSSLVTDVGLHVEFVTGSHAVRHSGNFLENYRWWLRLNQFWGALFPSLGSECYLMARRGTLGLEHPVRLYPHKTHNRPLWVSLGTAACVVLLCSGALAVNHLQSYQQKRISSWIEAHQEGTDTFVVWDPELKELCGLRSDLVCANSLSELWQHLETYDEAHLLVPLDRAVSLIKAHPEADWRIHSRLDFLGTDYLLLKHMEDGTLLKDYLLGAH